MKRKNGSNSVRMMLWVAIAALPLAALSEFSQRIPALAQDAKPSFEIPKSLPKDAAIKINGDPSMGLVNEALKQQFQSQFADAKVEVQTNGSDAALKNLADGKADVASTGRAPTDAELKAGLTPVVLQREKIAIFVAKENSFQGDIGYAQFAKLFRGEIKDWSELGGKAGAIRFVDRPGNSDVRNSFSTYPSFQSAPFTAGATAQAINEDNTALVIKNLGTDGIGYAPYNQVKDIPGIRIISMHKVLPDNPAYPYSQPRVLTYKGEPSPAVQAFLAVAQDGAGEKAIDTAEAAEAAALAKGENPIGDVALATLGAGAAAPAAKTTDGVLEGAVDGAAKAAGDTVDAAGDAATAAGDAANKTAGAVGDAAGNVAGAAGDAAGAVGDAAGNVAGAAGDAANKTAGAVGDAAAQLPDAGLLKGRGLSPLWGVLPLAAIAAGGGLLWWLAAGKDEDETTVVKESREPVAVGKGLREKTGEIGAGAVGLGAAGLGVAGGAVGGLQDGVSGVGEGIRGGAADLGDGIRGGVSGVGDGIRGGVSNVGEGIREGASGVTNRLQDGANGIRGGVSDVGEGIRGGVSGVGEGIRGGVSGMGSGLKDGVTGAVDVTKGVGSDISAKAAGIAGATAAGAAGLAAAAGNTAGDAAGKTGGFFSGLFSKAKDAAEATTDAAGVGIKGAGEVASGAVEGVTGTVGGVAHRLADNAGNSADGLKDGVANTADGIQDGASNLKNAAGETIQNLQEDSEDWRNDV